MPKIYIWNPTTCRFKNGKYVGSIADNLVITCDETIEETEIASTKSTATKTAPAKNASTNFYTLLAFLLITTALSSKNILIYDILYKILIVTKPLLINLDKMDGVCRPDDGTRFLVLLGAENLILFTTGLDIT